MQTEVAYPLREGHRSAAGFPGAIVLLRAMAAFDAPDASWWLVQIDATVTVVVQFPHGFGVASPTRVPRFLEGNGIVDVARRVVREGAGLTARNCAVDPAVDRDWAARTASAGKRWIIETGVTGAVVESASSASSPEGCS